MFEAAIIGFIGAGILLTGYGLMVTSCPRREDEEWTKWRRFVAGLTVFAFGELATMFLAKWLL